MLLWTSRHACEARNQAEDDNVLEQWFFNLILLQNPLEELVKTQLSGPFPRFSDSADLSWVQRIHISNRLLGNAEAVSPEITLWKTWQQIMKGNWLYHLILSFADLYVSWVWPHSQYLIHTNDAYFGMNTLCDAYSLWLSLYQLAPLQKELPVRTLKRICFIWQAPPLEIYFFLCLMPMFQAIVSDSNHLLSPGFDRLWTCSRILFFSCLSFLENEPPEFH